MVRQSLVSFLVFLIAVVGASPADTRDWFVKAGATGGDGSREQPFADPWQALERVEAHDKVHVAAGRYFGQLEAGTWVIPFPGVELLGGYDASFTERNPWQHVSELAWNAESANKPNVSRARVSMETNRDTTGAAIDGFLIDMRETYQYASGNLTTPYWNSAVSLAQGTAIRNCIIVNSANGAVKTSAGALVENNLIINTALVAIQATGGGNDAPPVVVRHNTIAFTWDPEAPGKGGTRGIAVAASNAVLVEHNLIVHADNFAVAITKPARSTFTGNVFYRNLFANLRFYLDSRESALDDTDLDAAEEIGFAHAGENLAADPALTFDAQWYDAFLRRTAGTGQRFDTAAWEQTRMNAGLPAPVSPEKLALFAPADHPRKAGHAAVDRVL